MEIRFQFLDFVKVFATSILIYAGFTVLFVLLKINGGDEYGAALRIEDFPPLVAFLIQYLIQFVILFFPLWVFVVNKYGTTLKDFGFHKIAWGKGLKAVLLAYATYMVISAVILALIASLNLKIPGYEAQESYLPLFGTAPLEIIGGFFFIVIVAPFLEELLFRGFIYRLFTKIWPLWVASLFAALLFALAHVQLQSFFPLLLLGLILNWTCRKTGSVWTAVAFHSLNNAVAFSVDIYFTLHPAALEQITAFIYTMRI